MNPAVVSMNFTAPIDLAIVATPTATPAPSSLALLGAGLGGLAFPQAPTHQLTIRAKCSSHRLSANMLKRHSLTSPRPLKGPSGSRSRDQPLDAIEFLPCAAVAAIGELVFTGQQKTRPPDILTEMGGLTVAVLNTSQTPVL